MLTKVSTVEHINEIVRYIGDNYKSTPYLFVDVLKYGLGTENVFSWIDRGIGNTIEGIYLLYYDCIHFYTNDSDTYPVERFFDFVEGNKHKVIMVQGGFGDRIDKKMTTYSSERNYVIDMDKCGLEEKDYRSSIATREDISEIVDLLMADQEYINVYDRQVLFNQMLDRFDGGFSRFFVVRMDGKIVATCSTYGEVDGFALIGGTIVHPNYRRMGLGGDVENYACHVMEEKKKSRVGFVNYQNTASIALHNKIGANCVATLAKYIKKE